MALSPFTLGYISTVLASIVYNYLKNSDKPTSKYQIALPGVVAKLDLFT